MTLGLEFSITPQVHLFYSGRLPLLFGAAVLQLHTGPFAHSVRKSMWPKGF